MSLINAIAWATTNKGTVKFGARSMGNWNTIVVSGFAYEMRNGDGTEKNIGIPAPKNTAEPTTCQAIRYPCSRVPLATINVTITALMAKKKSVSDPRIKK